MDMEYILILMGLYMKENGRKINKMEMDLNNGQMVLVIRDNTYRAKNKDREYLNGKMVLTSKVIFITIQSKD